MWHWDQGRLEYFQFDALRKIAEFVLRHDFKSADRQVLRAFTGLPFAAPETHSPWRNYSRILKLMLLISEENDVALPTPVAQILAQPGIVTCDEYMHFIATAFTEPSPALSSWHPNANFRYPLLFAVKYLLAKTVITESPYASLDEIIGAYAASNYSGEEDQTEFIAIMNNADYDLVGREAPPGLKRQAKESLKVISQISYLHLFSNQIFVSLHPSDAHAIFDDLTPIGGPRANDASAEIRRLAVLFRDGGNLTFEFPNTIVENVVESGFIEGNKVKRTHITIERNASLRREFFSRNATPVCDMCELDTHATYPWAERVLDLHHLLPLCSGTRVEGDRTTLNDLVPVCPNCHRAIHRYYDTWLSTNNRTDFADSAEAKTIYVEVKNNFEKRIYAHSV